MPKACSRHIRSFTRRSSNVTKRCSYIRRITMTGWSLHGEKNYPLVKQQSTLDVAMADGTTDDEYLYALALHLSTTLDRFRPDIVFYQAGVDPYYDDRLGRLALTLTGLRRRDEMVIA